MGKVVALLALVAFMAVCCAAAEAGEEVEVRGEAPLREAREAEPVRRRKGNSGGTRRNGSSRKRNGNRSSKQQSRTGRTRCSRQSTTFCPAEKAKSLKLLYNQVYNFEKQLKRAQSFATIVSKKKGKKDNFAATASILTDVVGGDLNKPSCAGARSATAAAGQATLLNNCSAALTEKCADITINATLSGACSDTMTAYKDKVATCKSDDSCTCWTEAYAMKSAVTACNALDEQNAVKTKKNTCKSSFSDCKKAQDTAVEFSSICPEKAATSMTTMGVATTLAAKRRQLVQRILANNRMMRSHRVNI